jgi:CRISPR-associated protein Csm1
LNNADEKWLDSVISGLEKRHRDEKLNDEEKCALTDNKFLLIGGDVSGVQKFIYSITSKGAAKGLRGRSLYLDLLSESIAKYLLRVLQLPLTNLLYCGGGHFYILAPNSAVSDLERLKIEIAEKILEIHKGELYLVLDWLPLSADDFQKEKFGQAWEGIGIKLGEKKKSKFAGILEQHEIIFGPIDKGGAINICDICGTEERVEEKEDRKICSFCESFEKLASDIGEAQYWIETWNKDLQLGDMEKGSWKAALALFGVVYEFEKSLKRDLKKKDADHIRVYKLNDTDFSAVIPDFMDGKSPTAFGFKFLAKNTPYKPDKEGHIKDFHEFAANSEGLKRWAVLRADVDDLGKIFSMGLGQNRTISRVSNLSLMLTLFFKGWMEKICQREEYQEKVYAIYSGGDDLFIVGSWARLPEIAKMIYADFRAFTCTNPNITLSAGISIAPSEKYPLYQAADLAKVSLEKSKGLDEKDGVTFLEMPMKWENFSGEVTMLQENLKTLLASGVSRAFLQKLNGIYEEYKVQKRRHGETLAKYDDRYGRWRWLLAYVKARTKVSKDKKELLKETEELARENIGCVSIAVRWVEYLKRTE